MVKGLRKSAKRHNRPLFQRVAIDIAGFSLVILAFLTGWLPGPGGIPLFLVGLGLLSLNYEWAERLLKNFDEKRREYTKKLSKASPAVSNSIDLICLFIIAGGIYGLINSDELWLQGVSLGLLLGAIVTFLSNQRRFQRIIHPRKSK